MDVAVESIASSLNLAVLKDHTHKHDHSKTELRSKPLRLPKMETPSKSKELIKRIYLTVAMFLVYHGMGLNSGIVGPTLVHLECLFETNTARISQVVMWMNVGYLIGSIFCVVAFDRINQEIQFAFWGFMVAITTALLPWMPNLYVYFALTTIQFISHGIMYSGGQAFTLKLWLGNSYHRSILQATHLMWSIGGFIGPFISMPFLVELNNNGTFCGSNEDISITESNYTTDTVLIRSDDENLKLEGVYKIRYIYGIVGIVDMIGAVLFFIGFLIMGPKCRPHSYEAINVTSEATDEPDQPSNKPKNVINKDDSTSVKTFKIIMLFTIIVIVILFFWHETVMGMYMSAFVIKGFEWTSENGALVASVFFGFHGLGRLAGVFISKFLIPSRVIFINMIFATLGMVLLLFSYTSNIIVFLGTAMIGFFIATTFPNLILWLSDYIAINGAMGGTFMAAASFGSMTVAPLTGYLFQKYTHMWVVYISLGSAILCIGIFLVLLVLGKIVRKYQKQNESIDSKPLENGNLVNGQQENENLDSKPNENGNLINGDVKA